ncbi:bifunctional glutamate--cysteine ligase GshA/glutathione synthetase GshB [Enterococcus hirae]|nr:bifunctional glutamate--cysteine ligase GshA/glutathione synthetase GshB [Enterococcus hirae]
MTNSIPKKLAPLFLRGRYGLERESQRVDHDGKLAKTPHPKKLGDRSYHHTIQTDFSETQIELITPVLSSISGMLDYVEALYDVALRSMDKKEMLWPASMPPVLPAQEEEIEIADLKRFEEVLYRRYLAKVYGKRKQMVSGIHFNFEICPEFFDELAREWDCSANEARNEVYLKISRNYLRSRWLITYLFGATPVAADGYFEKDDPRPETLVRSLRSSRFGYTNHENLQADYTSYQKYQQSIRQMVTDGLLSEEKEFYAPLRLRSGGPFKEFGDHVRYLEIRNIDIDPFARAGITQEELVFIRLFLLYLAFSPEDADRQMIEEGNQINDQIALEHPRQVSRYQKEGLAVLAGMEKMAAEYQLPLPKYLLEDAKRAFLDPNETLAVRLLDQLEEQGHLKQGDPLPQYAEAFLTFGTAAAKKYYSSAWEKDYLLSGFSDMELSTQLLMFDALQKGLGMEVLDREEQFLSLSGFGRKEYVKNANMTSKDTYVSALIMENKVVTKKILERAGFRVPHGLEFSSFEKARAAYEQVKWLGEGVVIKPKTTNYGIGISIFKGRFSADDYEEALRIAFEEDAAILVEEFFAGTEYRFFVLGDHVSAVLERTPANVTGDGVNTITQLVEEKNEDPLRGTHHRAPLEEIQLSEVERLMLKEQQLTPESVPAAGQTVYLRENSNVSTGGDSIDRTDELPQAYKEIAVQAVRALGAKISGIDLIIPDMNVSAQAPNAYGILEANFNPAMHMHIYPYQGTSRRLTMEIIEMLFPEVKKQK